MNADMAIAHFRIAKSDFEPIAACTSFELDLEVSLARRCHKRIQVFIERSEIDDGEHAAYVELLVQLLPRRGFRR